MQNKKENKVLVKKKEGCHCEATEGCVAIPLLTTTQKVITSLQNAGVVIAY